MSNLALRQFMIIHGDTDLANNWLAKITTAIWDEEPLDQDDKEAIVVSLMALIHRGEAPRFWNNGKTPHKRLDILSELSALNTVEQLLIKNRGEKLSEVLGYAAEELGYTNHDSSDEEDDAGIERITGEYRRAKEKLILFKEKLDLETAKLHEQKLTPWT